MATYTNLHNIEDAIARAVSNDPYEQGGDISVTGLIRPPQMAALEYQHRDEITEDVSERLWALLGQTVHVILDRASHPDAVTEKRVEAKVLGWKVTGRPDLWREVWSGPIDDARGTLRVAQPDEGEIVDYKVTSVWSLLLDDKADWAMQVNLYAALYRRAGYSVTKLTIAAILRDHIKSKALSDPGYPKIPFIQKDIPCWPPENAERVLEERVRLHQTARAGDYPPCTDAERWHKDDKFAVMKEGRKSAIRVLDTPEAAARVQESEQRVGGRGSYSIQHRPGEDTRCKSYCSAMPFCQQARDLGVTKGDGNGHS